MFKEALSICIKHLDAMLIKVPRKVVSPMGADSSRNGLSSSRKQQSKKSEVSLGGGQGSLAEARSLPLSLHRGVWH